MGHNESSEEDQLAFNLFDEVDADLDSHTVENALLDGRGRLESLTVYEKARLAERIIQSNLPDILDAAGDIDLSLAEFFDSAITEARILDAECALCGQEITDKEFDSCMVEQTIWTGPARNGSQVRTDTGRRAHDDCVKKLKDGGDPAERPMW